MSSSITAARLLDALDVMAYQSCEEKIPCSNISILIHTPSSLLFILKSSSPTTTMTDPQFILSAYPQPPTDHRHYRNIPKLALVVTTKKKNSVASPSPDSTARKHSPVLPLASFLESAARRLLGGSFSFLFLLALLRGRKGRRLAWVRDGCG